MNSAWNWSQGSLAYFVIYLLMMIILVSNLILPVVIAPFGRAQMINAMTDSRNRDANLILAFHYIKTRPPIDDQASSYGGDGWVTKETWDELTDHLRLSNYMSFFPAWRNNKRLEIQAMFEPG
jgi:CBS-domain-containing membrane protein